jgi:hypothetical protein
MTANTATAVQAIQGEVSANEFHRRTVAALHTAEVPILIGGAYMVEVCRVARKISTSMFGQII